MLTDTFQPPATFDGVLPCTAKASAFTSRALDADPYDLDFQDMTSQQQREALAAKQVAEQACIAVCVNCPVLAECRTWAMSVHVHGVAGGTTQAERRAAAGWTGPELVPGEPSPRAGRDTTIAKPASGTLNIARVSPETLTMLEFIADGAGLIRDREDVIASAAHHVDDDTADKWGRHSAGDATQKRAAGRRKFLLNRLDIAVRRGRINATRTDQGVMLALAEDVAAALRDSSVAA